MDKISEIMRNARKQAGLNQKDFAKTLAVSQSYICKIETGKEIPTKMLVKLFCLLYNIDEVSP